MATAAALAFELVQRTWDCFGIPDPALIGGGDACEQGEIERGIKWEDYKPGVSIIVRQWKTGNLLKIPLVDRLDDGQPVALYPELEDQLAAARPATPQGMIVVEERNGNRYKHRRMSTVHRKICNAAGLPKDMAFTGFRHGGATEIGDRARSISGQYRATRSSLGPPSATTSAARRLSASQHDGASILLKSLQASAICRNDHLLDVGIDP